MWPGLATISPSCIASKRSFLKQRHSISRCSAMQLSHQSYTLVPILQPSVQCLAYSAVYGFVHTSIFLHLLVWPFALPCALPFAWPSALSFCIVLLHCPFALPSARPSACLQCVDKMRSCYGNDDIRVGAALHNMAGLYLSIKPPDYSGAEAILREALDVSPFFFIIFFFFFFLNSFLIVN